MCQTKQGMFRFSMTIVRDYFHLYTQFPTLIPFIVMNRSLPDGALPARNSVLVKFTGSEAAIRQDMTAVNKTLKRYKDTHPTLTLVESDVAEMLSKSPMSSHSLMRETSVRWVVFVPLNQLILFTDFFLSVPISHLPQLLQEAKEHFAEMSFASAFSADVKTGKHSHAYP